jgi:hypothetical protein
VPLVEIVARFGRDVVPDGDDAKAGEAHVRSVLVDTATARRNDSVNPALVSMSPSILA